MNRIEYDLLKRKYKPLHDKGIILNNNDNVDNAWKYDKARDIFCKSGGGSGGSFTYMSYINNDEFIVSDCNKKFTYKIQGYEPVNDIFCSDLPLKITLKCNGRVTSKK